MRMIRRIGVRPMRNRPPHRHGQGEGPEAVAHPDGARAEAVVADAGDGDRHQRARVNQAMRSSICEQVVEFATTQEKVCYACMTTDSLTVDHVWPPFSHIVSGYISQFGDPVIVEDAGSGFKFADPDEEQRWQDYHAVEAKLGMLCQTCNRKKGTKRP